MNEQVLKLLVGQFHMETDGLSIAVSVVLTIEMSWLIWGLWSKLSCFDDTHTKRNTHTHTTLSPSNLD